MNDPQSIELLKNASIPIVANPPKNTELLIYSLAILKNHPILKKAQEQNIPTINRDIFLSKLTQSKKLIAVVGNHGKTSTSALIVEFLEREHFPFDYIIGGFFQDARYLPTHYQANNEWMLCEINESNKAFNLFSPDIAVFTKLDWEHTDYYQSKEALEETFKNFFQRTQTAVIAFKNKTSEKLISKEKQVFCPIKEDYRKENIYLARKTVEFLTKRSCTFTKQRKALHRRLETLLETPLLKCISDYAHHSS